VPAGDLSWLPSGGAHLTQLELAGVVRALRALIDDTEPGDPNHAHAVTIAYLIAGAVDRRGGSE
jgi:hypothetical protein